MERLNLARLAAAALASVSPVQSVAAQSVLEFGRPVPHSPPHQPTEMIRHGIIAGFQVPSFGSGILHVYATFQVRAPGDHVYQMLWTYLGPGGQFIPPVGSVCQIAFHYEARVEIEPAPPVETDFSRPHMIVDEWDCDTGKAGQDRP